MEMEGQVSVCSEYCCGVIPGQHEKKPRLGRKLAQTTTTKTVEK